MKILIKVTKDILKKSMMCGYHAVPETGSIKELQKSSIGSNCAFALAVREIWPEACVGLKIYPYYYANDGILNMSTPIHLPTKALLYISKFDALILTPEKRLELPEISVEIDVPYCILEKVGISEVYKILSESKTLECVSI